VPEPEKSFLKAEPRQYLHSRGVDGVTPELPVEVQVSLEERHVHPSTGQQERQRQACRSTAHDAAIRPLYIAETASGTWPTGRPGSRNLAVSYDGLVYSLPHDTDVIVLTTAFCVISLIIYSNPLASQSRATAAVQD
jgi:hypothetical protein